MTDMTQEWMKQKLHSLEREEIANKSKTEEKERKGAA